MFIWSYKFWALIERKITMTQEEKDKSVSLFDKEVEAFCKETFIKDKDMKGLIFCCARHFADWQKQRDMGLLKTLYSDYDNLKKDLDKVTTGNLSHRIGNIKFSITGMQVFIKKEIGDE